jgi:hypothetical protein
MVKDTQVGSTHITFIVISPSMTILRDEEHDFAKSPMTL